MKKLLIFLSALTAAFFMNGCSSSQAGEPSYKQVSTEEAVTMMAEENGYIILDVRTQEEFQQGHIPDAICVPNESIGGTQPDQLPDTEQRIFIYSRSGNRSKQAAKKLADLGYTNLVEFGGINSWTGELEHGDS